MTEGSGPSSRAFVPTGSAPRYLKQLVGHLGRRLAVTEDGDARDFAFDGLGRCRVVPTEHGLELAATADTADGLDRIQEVVGRHLERFGQRHELTVRWSPAPAG